MVPAWNFILPPDEADDVLDGYLQFGRSGEVSQFKAAKGSLDFRIGGELAAFGLR